MNHPKNDQQTLILEPGAKARVTATTAAADYPNPWTERRWPGGFEFIVEAYEPADESEDGNAVYWGRSANGFGDVVVPANLVEQVMSAQEMADRQVPTLKELRQFVGGELCGEDGDNFTIDAANYLGDGDEVELEGETDDGLRFGFAVKVMPAAKQEW